MPHVSHASRRRILLYVLGVALTAATYYLPARIQPLPDLATLLYCILVLAWGLSVRRRILQRSTRQYLLAGTGFLVGLFVLRLCRWKLFAWWEAVDGLLWYGYYIPFTAVPLLSLLAALEVGRTEGERPRGPVLGLVPLWVLLCLGLMTNGLHHQLLRTVGGRTEYGPLYWIVVAWSTGLSVAAFAILMWECRVSRVRRLWWIPMLPVALGMGLMAAYFVFDGPPMVLGLKLYNLQEAYAFLFIGLWESCIQIGLIPANSDYDALFRLAPLNAAIADNAGQVVYRSLEMDRGDASRYRIHRAAPIPGGEVTWSEDLGAIEQLNRSIAEAAELVEDENSLMEEENRVRAEKARLEAQNRLFDKIEAAVRPELLALSDLLGQAEQAERFAAVMPRVLVLGAFIKRRANLSLLADQRPTLPVEELGHALRESFEYLTLGGTVCSLGTRDRGEAPSEALLLAYDLAETAVEAGMERCGTFAVELGTEPGFFMEMAADTEKPLLDRAWRREELARLDLRLRVAVRDETTYLSLTGGEGAEA